MSSLLAVGALLHSAPANAVNDWLKFYVSPGVVFSLPTGGAPSYGAGFELTAGYANVLEASHWYFPHASLLYRHQPSSRGGLDTFGVQGGGGPLDLELGYGLRGSSREGDLLRAASGVHLGATLSMGVLYAGPQFILPTDGGSPECVIGIGLKLPLPHVLLIPALARIDWGRMAR